MTDDDYYTIRSGGGVERTRPVGALRAATVFAAVVLAVTAIAVPVLSERGARGPQFASRPPDLDRVVTGSIRGTDPLPARPPRPLGPPRVAPPAGIAPDRTAREGGRTYVVRRSVLSGSSVCILRADGSREGNC